MSVRIEVRSELYLWARDRSGIDGETWDQRFPSFDSWVEGRTSPTLKQLEDFASKTHTPFGYFLLDEPPVEPIPIPDFRTISDRPLGAVSASVDLLDVVYTCQARQEWYRDHQLRSGEAPLPFVNSTSMTTSPLEAATSIRSVLGWNRPTRVRLRSWSESLTALRERAEAAGILVAISGIVGSNTHRKLDPEEFRGFALVDPHSSLIFVNGADTKAAQIFTLAHELAHVWLGQTGLSDVDGPSLRRNDTERWCNEVAAELLVPMDEFLREVNGATPDSQLQRLAEQFRVSTQVILGRFREAGIIDWDQFLRLLATERARWESQPVPASSGGNYYNTKPVQVSKRFARSVVSSALEGETSFSEAFRLLELKKAATFEGLAAQLEVG